MPCYHPLKGFIVGKTENGKKNLVITPYDTECVFKPLGSESWEKHGHVLDGLIVQGRVVTEFVPIPCGQCVGCRLDYSRQWAIRCMLESEYHENNYFITLTYNEENVIHTGYYDENGVFSDSLTLYKKDLQDFIKRLRSDRDYHDGSKFRYYACGEYGSQSARPHYHIIAFGLSIPDLKPSTRFRGYYESELITRKWSKGNVIIGSVTFESCAYVSRYIMKKQKGETASVYNTFNILPEFVVMSRRPGIAKEYFEDHIYDIYPSDNIVINGGKLVTPPRYFDYLMDKIDESLMEDIKLKRSDIAKRIQEYKLSNTSQDLICMLESAERNKEAIVKKLVRKLDTC